MVFGNDQNIRCGGGSGGSDVGHVGGGGDEWCIIW